MSVNLISYEKSTLVTSEKYIGLDVHQATISVAVMDASGKLVMESIPETEASAPLQVLGWRTAMVRPSGFIGRFRRRHELASRRAATRSGSKICPDATVPHKSITSRHICPNFIGWPSRYLMR